MAIGEIKCGVCGKTGDGGYVTQCDECAMKELRRSDLLETAARELADAEESLARCPADCLCKAAARSRAAIADLCGIADRKYGDTP